MITLYFILCFLSGSFILAGWYIITRGEWVCSVDGKLSSNGKIFKFWSKFWEGYTVQKGSMLIYEGAAFYKMISLMENVFGMNVIDERRKYTINEESDGRAYLVHIPNEQSLAHFSINWWRVKSINPDVRYEVSEPMDNGYFVFFYEHKKKYHFPHWIRKPLSSCIYCYGSFYGSLVWWVFHWANLMLTTDQAFLLWVPYCISLTVGAAIVWKTTTK